MRPMGVKGRLTLFFASAFFRAGDLLRRLKGGGIMDERAAAPGRIYDFEARTIGGKPKPLADYKGKVLLIVNTASLCGFTPQYDGLEAVHRKYRDKGLRVLAFPANEFGAQEPGPDPEISDFCRTKYSVSFDLFSKIVVKGQGIHPLYRFLTTESGFNGEIPWNFTKFLVGKDGRVAARFPPPADPMSASVRRGIEELLGA